MLPAHLVDRILLAQLPLLLREDDVDRALTLVPRLLGTHRPGDPKQERERQLSHAYPMAGVSLVDLDLLFYRDLNSNFREVTKRGGVPFFY